MAVARAWAMGTSRAESRKSTGGWSRVIRNPKPRVTAETPSGIVELCLDDDDHPEQLAEIEALYRECWPTTRHQGLCRPCCGDDCGRGANAYSGTYCP